MIDENPFEIPNDIIKQQKNINMQVANITTPSNFFHLLRRQVLRNFRKPLIVMTPKMLLKFRLCKSNLSEFDIGTSFKRLIQDDSHTQFNLKSLENVKKILFCSGQIYYNLLEKRNEKNLINNIAIIRIEQIAPFPFDLVIEQLKKYPNAKPIWVQEEHLNMGCWSFIEPRFETCYKSLNLKTRIEYIGRPISAAPSTGFKDAHDKQQEKLLKEVFN